MEAVQKYGQCIECVLGVFDGDAGSCRWVLCTLRCQVALEVTPLSSLSIPRRSRLGVSSPLLPSLVCCRRPEQTPVAGSARICQDGSDIGRHPGLSSEETRYWLICQQDAWVRSNTPDTDRLVFVVKYSPLMKSASAARPHFLGNRRAGRGRDVPPGHRVDSKAHF